MAPKCLEHFVELRIEPSDLPALVIQPGPEAALTASLETGGCSLLWPARTCCACGSANATLLTVPTALLSTPW